MNVILSTALHGCHKPSRDSIFRTAAKKSDCNSFGNQPREFNSIPAFRVSSHGTEFRFRLLGNSETDTDPKMRMSLAVTRSSSFRRCVCRVAWAAGTSPVAVDDTVGAARGMHINCQPELELQSAGESGRAKQQNRATFTPRSPTWSRKKEQSRTAKNATKPQRSVRSHRRKLGIATAPNADRTNPGSRRRSA